MILAIVFFFLLLNVDFHTCKNLQNSTGFQKHYINQTPCRWCKYQKYTVWELWRIYFSTTITLSSGWRMLFFFFFRCQPTTEEEEGGAVTKGARVRRCFHLMWHFSLLGELVRGMLLSSPQSKHHCGLLSSAAATISIVSVQRSERRKLCSRRCHAASTSHHLLSFSLSTDLICIERSDLSDWSYSFSYLSPPLSSSSSVFVCVHTEILSLQLFGFLGEAKHFTSIFTSFYLLDIMTW